MDQPVAAPLQQQWHERGLLILPGFFADADIDAALADYRTAWTVRAPRVTVDDMDTDTRMLLRKVPDTARQAHRFKVNDLYLEQPSVRHLALNDRLVPVLQSLLGQAPALCNSLSLEYGTEQPDHVDSIYMTPRSPNDLVAVWVALEDCQPGAGLLRYWPGSHRIPPYVFSTGTRHYQPAEMEAWAEHMRGEATARKLSPELFQAKKGDVLIWNAHLLHGGSAITAPGQTRRSIVFHYFSEADCRAEGARLVAESGGFWVRRTHQPVPGSLKAHVRGTASRLRRTLRQRFG
jgi:phytanoyl-CoA hydroxylase